MRFLGDVFDVASDAWDATGGRVVGGAADVATSVIDFIPGGSGLREALDKMMVGPVRDFAKTVPGRIFFTALGSTFYGSIAWVAGPQIASIAFAVPGLAAGDDLVTAYLQGLRQRAEQTMQIVGIPGFGSEFIDDVVKTLKQLAEDYGVAGYVREGVLDISKRIGVRIDAAAAARAIYNREPLPVWASFGLGGAPLPKTQTSVAGANDPSLVARFTEPQKFLATPQQVTQMNLAGRFLGLDKVASPAAPMPSYDRAVAQPAGTPWLMIAGFAAGVVVVGAGAWYAAGKS